MRKKGFYCPNCPGLRLFVVTVVSRCPGRRDRYRECRSCAYRIKTIEREVPIRKKKPRTSETVQVSTIAPIATTKRVQPTLFDTLPPSQN